ncbi:VanZ family protein [Paenibacillus herberti]|uniref:VanZ family protein n=1 Tax=Paenibacillus herberti TaxID=1619309 RepID=A0A229P0L5_9BACL|nr:VanZ family protein [Paenibacillus herberti]OXM15561.1 VanZ family protein [Paenibacillus herberti]
MKNINGMNNSASGSLSNSLFVQSHDAETRGGSRKAPVLIRSRWVAYSARFLILLYACFLIKAILFKFGSSDSGFLWNQLQTSLSDPHLVKDRMQAGNLEPFRQMKSDLRYGSVNGYTNLFGNIAIFVPFGFLMGLLTFKRNFPLLAGAVLCFGTSLALESAQLLFSIGQFDVDDLILNTSGGLAGLIIVVVLSWMFKSSAK